MKHIGHYIVIGSAIIACGIALSGGIYDIKTSGTGAIAHRINKWTGEVITCMVTKGCKPPNDF